MSREKQIDIITDLLIDFDEMGFAPTTLVPNPEAYAIEWRKKLTEALQGYRKQSENTVELPCKVGDSVWCIYNYTKPKEFQIAILTMSKNHYSFTIETKDGIYKHYCDKEAVGKWVFFTKEEAEEALAKMKGGAEE